MVHTPSRLKQKYVVLRENLFYIFPEMETDFSLSVTDLSSKFHVIYFTVTIRWTLSRKDLLNCFRTRKPGGKEKNHLIKWRKAFPPPEDNLITLEVNVSSDHSHSFQGYFLNYTTSQKELSQCLCMLKDNPGKRLNSLSSTIKTENYTTCCFTLQY